MIAEKINIAWLGDRIGGSLWHRVFIGKPSGLLVFGQAFQFVGIKAGKTEVVAEILQILQFERKQFVIPFRPGYRTVGKQAERFYLRL